MSIKFHLLLSQLDVFFHKDHRAVNNEEVDNFIKTKRQGKLGSRYVG